MFKSWEKHKAEMEKDDASEDRKVLIFCGAVFGLVIFVIVLPSLL